MTTEIQVDDGNGDWRDIDHGEWEIENGVSDILNAPTANVRTHIDEDIDAYQPIRIRIDGTTRFEGRTVSSGRHELGGGRRIQARHEAYDLFDEEVSFELSNTDTEEVLQEAVDDATIGGFSVDYAGSTTLIADSYIAESRKVNRVFQDMMDRTSRVWWVDVDDVIHVEPYADRGEWTSVSFPGDDGGVVQYDEGEVSTVRNDVTVNGTREERVTGNASDTGSIVEYGRHAETVNIEYITSESEADAMADELLIPEPLAEAEVQLGSSVAETPDQNLSNLELVVSDDGKRIEDEPLVIEKQTIEQGRVTLEVGEGSGISMENVNLSSKSSADNSEPGSVYDTDRISDDAIVEDKIVDLEISETKIDDDAISTPKLQANAVEANNISANTITAALIDSLELETEQLTIGSDTDGEVVFQATDENGITFLDMDPETGSNGRIGHERAWGYGRFVQLISDQFTVSAGGNGLFPTDDNDADIGTSSFAFADIYAHNFNELSPEPLADVDLAELTGYRWEKPPEYVAQKKDRNGGYRHRNPRKGGIELGHMSNYLFEVCKAQQRVIDDLADRVDELESKNWDE